MRIERVGHAFLLALAILCLGATAAAFGHEPGPGDADKVRTEITDMLRAFLDPAVNNTAAGHDRFWADDLVYTSSAGLVTRKADIMRSFDDAPEPAADQSPDPDPVYSAEDILVRPYGDMAALTFRLVGRDPDGTITHYRNSGTFLRRNGNWQAVTWQATKVPEQAP